MREDHEDLRSRADTGGTERAIAAIEEPIRQVRADEDRFRHLAYLPAIAEEDIAQLNQKEREYGASWKKRGGVGAFMMLARKWDRFENMVDEMKTYRPAQGNYPQVPPKYVAGPYDVFSHVEGSNLEGKAAESLIDTIGDLRRYLFLLEAEMRSRAGVPIASDGNVMGTQVEETVTTESLNDLAAASTVVRVSQL